MPALQREMQALSTLIFRYFTCLLDKGHINKLKHGFYRIHSSLGYLTPVEYRMNNLKKVVYFTVDNPLSARTAG